MPENTARLTLLSMMSDLEHLLKRHLATLRNSQLERKQNNNNNNKMKKTSSRQHDFYQATPLPANILVASVSYKNLHNTNNKNKEKITVRVKVNFMKIGVIDTIRDRYHADVMVQTKWREPKFDEYALSLDQANLESCWNPHVTIWNGVEDLQYETTIFLELDSDQRAWICERKRTRGQFFEFMELRKFPFDEQDLTVMVVSDRSEAELEFLQDCNQKSAVNPDTFSAAQEWYLYNDVTVWTKITVKNKENHPCFCVAAKVSRRPQFFIYNIVVFMFFICSLSFATFSVQLKLPEFRILLTFLLIQTTVTFKFTVNNNLPKIPYLTYLDKYILGSMTILCCIGIWHSVCGSLIAPVSPSDNTSAAFNTSLVLAETFSCEKIVKQDPTETILLVDRVVLGIFAFAYITFHFWFLVLIIHYHKGSADDNRDLPSNPGSRDH
ncbi:hypothetical protein HELRODRAFT_176770 [Helobdella robusta]|uniref:Neurotransmitter-gated ion-channel ligand-binding domain-containing protein n=1 Tax=Helobdella robusta TaxID=6412 RepID=T1FAW4_HELRO|nr:hypothetical protein HELRODRAFT_176770 [Helobdella robusta]ESN99605.1 hypothetical protein HELRODRAFT_176770 [Helobdella robusta]